MRLKHFPTGLLRCGISKRKAKLFVTALMVAATAQTCFAQTTGTGTSGKEGEQPIAAWTSTTPSEANGKTVYLYNVGTKQFLGKGGRWGTEATMNVEGTPFTLTYSSDTETFTLTSKVKQEGGDSNGMLTLMDGTVLTSKYDKFNYFVDGNVTASENRTFTATGTPTEGYTLSITSTSSTPSTGNKSSMAGLTFYMFAEGANAHVSARLETATSDMLGIPADSKAYSKWVIVTEDQRKDAFKTVNNAHVAAVNATFLMSDFDFARNDNSCENWMTGATADGATTGKLSYKDNKQCKPEDAYKKATTTYVYKSKHTYTTFLGFGQSHTDYYESAELLGNTQNIGDKYEVQMTCGQNDKHTGTYKDQKYTYVLEEIKTTDAGYTYYLGNGYTGSATLDYETGETYTDAVNLQESYGGAWTANIHGKRGSVVQTIPTENMIKEGWYRVSCVGFTTTKKGIARLFAAAGMGNTTGSATEQTKKFAIANLHRIDAATRPATYVAASKLLDTPNVNTFDASVMVYVGKNGTAYETLSFGIQVGSAAADTLDADDDAWTCFDNFKIEYLGTPEHELILDEDQTDASYIKAQAPELADNETLQKSIVYLHRTMNPDKWNSLVLPINLNVAQVKRIFGDQVHISKFFGAREDHPQRIVFDPITANRNDPDAIAIEAGKLYLVKPTADGGMPQKQTVKTFNKDGYNISVEDYYTIVGVTFKKKSEIADNAYSGRVMGTTGNEDFDTKQQVQFVGTYVKCFDNDLIPANSYVLNGNNVGGTTGLWYYRTVKTKTKGFRGWLQSVTGQASNVFEYEIEGVVEQVNGNTTAIDGIEAAQQHSANIYNLNGQLVRQGATSTEGLPSGLYIVGGKKLVVK